MTTKVSFVKSCLHHPESNQKLVKDIQQFFPSTISEYREPFVGTGAMVLYIQQLYGYDIKRYWINDNNFGIYCFWKTVRDDPTFFQDMLSKLREGYNNDKNELYEIYRYNLPGNTNIDEALGYFILNNITVFNGSIKDSKFSEKKYEKNFTIENIANISNLHYLIQFTDITNLDYSKLFYTIMPYTFTYMEPPLKEFDYVEFSEKVKQIAGNWCVVIDDTESNRTLFKNWNYIYSLKNKLVITSYEVKYKKESLISSQIII